MIVDGGRDPGAAALGEAFDYVIVGSGAAGATAARVLAEVGASVAVVEEGPAVGTADFKDRAAVSLRGLYRDMGAQLTRGRAPIPVFQGRCLGGSTVVNSAIMWRLPQDVWEAWRSEFGLGEALPFAELERRSDLIEAELSVAQTPEAVWGGNNRLMAEAGRALGVRAAPTRRAVVGCRGSARCQSGCPHGAKQSMAVTYLPRAERRGAVLFVNAEVSSVAMDGDRAVGVRGRLAVAQGPPGGGGAGSRRRRAFGLRARRGVIVAASAVQTPGLLRRSGVRSPHLGAHFQAHPGASLIGLFDREVGLWHGATQGFEADERRRTGRFKVETLALAPELLIAALPGVGRRWMRWIARAPRMAVWDVELRAHAEGRVASGRTGTRIAFAPERRDIANLRAAMAHAAELMFAAGATAVLPGIVGLPDALDARDGVRRIANGPGDPRAYTMALTHLFGTARMGATPAAGVVGPDFAVHGTRNLFVLDSSVFPTNTGVNPQLSIMAVAMLGADRIAERGRHGG